MQRKLQTYPVDLDEAVDRPQTIRLKDGAELELRVQVVGVQRVAFAKTETGDPVYQVQHQATVRVVKRPADFSADKPQLVS